MNTILDALNKIRLLETEMLAEALTPAEQQELDALARDFTPMSKDPAVAPLMQQYSALPGSQLNVSTPGATPAAVKAKATPDPAVLKIQQDLIAKGAKIKADGIMGPATKAAMEKDKAATATQPAAAAATTPTGAPPELASIPTPKQGQEHWVKGTRYEYAATTTRDNKGGWTTTGGKWTPTFKPGDWGWNTNQAKATAGYTGPDSGQIAQAADKIKPATAPAQPAATATINRPTGTPAVQTSPKIPGAYTPAKPA